MWFRKKKPTTISPLYAFDKGRFTIRVRSIPTSVVTTVGDSLALAIDGPKYMVVMPGSKLVSSGWAGTLPAGKPLDITYEAHLRMVDVQVVEGLD